MRNAFWSKDLVFSTKSHWFSMISWDLQVEAGAAGSTCSIIFIPNLWSRAMIFMRSMIDGSALRRVSFPFFPQCSRAWCCRECLGSGGLMCSQRSRAQPGAALAWLHQLRIWSQRTFALTCQRFPGIPGMGIQWYTTLCNQFMTMIPWPVNRKGMYITLWSVEQRWYRTQPIAR